MGVNTRKLWLWALFSFLLFLASASGHPVIFKGGTATQVDYMENDQSAYLYHSLTRFDAVGARMWRLDGAKGIEDRIFGFAQYNRLAKRWFDESYQANLYLGASLGAALTDGEDTEPAAGWLIQSDWETLHWYLAFQSVSGITQDFSHIKNAVTLGYTPYKADYDEVSVWLMFRVQHISEFSEDTVLMPFIRLFTNSIFLEAGVTTEGDPRFMIMYHF